MSDEPKLERMLKAFINIRDERSRRKKEFDEQDRELRGKQETLQSALLMKMREVGTTQLKVPGVATAVAQDKTSIRAADWDAVWNFIEENGRLDFLQRRLATRAIQTYMEENDGAKPPGVELFVEKVVSVRRN